jgi:GTPase
VIQVLLNSGADVNAQSKGEWTPLEFAIRQKQRDAVKVLEQAGGKVIPTKSPGLLSRLVGFLGLSPAQKLMAKNVSLPHEATVVARVRVQEASFEKQKGLFAAGQLESGALKVGDVVYVVNDSKSITRKSRVLALVSMGKVVDEASAGEQVAAHLEGIADGEVTPGTLLMKLAP